MPAVIVMGRNAIVLSGSAAPVVVWLMLAAAVQVAPEVPPAKAADESTVELFSGPAPKSESE